MNKFYNTQDEIASDLINFFDKCNLILSKPNKKMLAYSIISMCDSESVVTANLASAISSEFFSYNSKSRQRRFWRFFNNDNIKIDSIYPKIIKDVISRISNVKHNELIVTLDHMYIKNNFVVLMFTLRIDHQGIPIRFSLERTLSNCHHEIEEKSRKKLFSEKFIKKAIKKVVKLLAPLNAKIIFLADRWFFNLSILKYIESLGQFFAFRAKANSSVKVLAYDKKEGHNIYKNLSDFKPYVFKTAFHEDLIFGDMKFKCNLAISPSDRTDDEEQWYIVTNLKPKLAIRKYKKRFGAIEMFFKSQKTNGFYLEKTKTKNLKAMELLYTVACIANLWISILGIDYIKNYNRKKKIINIAFYYTTPTGKKERTLSTFRLGLTLFSMVYKDFINYKLKCDFRLYI